ncbi:hypothetical protein [Ruegeria hyattellae]|uniref:hypothetical protein n=1 Tax=Ruegeria hyattellae TaxID=3233337 RepID=UPI00355C9B33
MEAEIEADFFGPPIEELPLHYVQDWYFAAYDPQGIAKATWGYLLPRILEILAVDEEVAAVGLEVSLNRFETGNPENWSPDEWQVLDRFQRAFLRREIERDTEYLDDTLCMFALAGWPLGDLLDQIAATPDATLVRRLWSDWCKGCRPGNESIWITAFWEHPGNITVYEFYTSTALYSRIEKLALAQDTAPELAEKAIAVASVIETYAARA